MIPLARAEERIGVDFQLQYVPMSTIRGSLIGPSSMMPYLTHRSPDCDRRSDPVGHEQRRSENLGHGEGGIQFRERTARVVRRGREAVQSGTNVLWATADVVADGQSQPEVALSMQQGLTVSGRVAFRRTEPPSRPPPGCGFSWCQFCLVPRSAWRPTPARVDDAGRFSITGVAAGKYRLQASIDGLLRLDARVIDGQRPRRARCADRSATEPRRRGRDVFGSSRQNCPGLFETAAGRPVNADTVILFPADRTLWTPGVATNSCLPVGRRRHVPVPSAASR